MTSYIVAHVSPGSSLALGCFLSGLLDNVHLILGETVFGPAQELDVFDHGTHLAFRQVVEKRNDFLDGPSFHRILLLCGSSTHHLQDTTDQPVAAKPISNDLASATFPNVSS